MADTFGKFSLKKLIARGGMAEVFLALEDTPHTGQRFVVLKRILPIYKNDPDFEEFFIHEARLALQLSHPNIAQAYEFGTIEDVHYLSLEYVRGESLLSVLRRAATLGRVLSLDAIVKIGADLAAALDSAHNTRDVHGQPLRIIHRDVSPHNVIVSQSGNAKLVDFGIARAECQEFQTRAGIIKGKFAYLAPEQIKCGRNIDQRVDLFALGIVLYEMLTLRPLFRGTSQVDTIQRVIGGKIPPVRKLRPDTPELLEAIVARCLERDPERRYANAAAILCDLEEAARTSSLRANLSHLREEIGALFLGDTDRTVQVATPALSDTAQAARAQLSETPSQAASAAPIAVAEAPRTEPIVRSKQSPRTPNVPAPTWALADDALLYFLRVAGARIPSAGAVVEIANVPAPPAPSRSTKDTFDQLRALLPPAQHLGGKPLADLAVESALPVTDVTQPLLSGVSFVRPTPSLSPVWIPPPRIESGPTLLPSAISEMARAPIVSTSAPPALPAFRRMRRRTRLVVAMASIGLVMALVLCRWLY